MFFDQSGLFEKNYCHSANIIKSEYCSSASAELKKQKQKQNALRKMESSYNQHGIDKISKSYTGSRFDLRRTPIARHRPEALLKCARVRVNYAPPVSAKATL